MGLESKYSRINSSTAFSITCNRDGRKSVSSEAADKSRTKHKFLDIPRRTAVSDWRFRSLPSVKLPLISL